MDDYSILIGAAPTTKEQQEAIANSLRRRRAFGELGQMTGDKVLAPFGAGLASQADEYAKQIQKTRLADVDNEQTAKFQGAQMEQMQKTHALQQAMLAETRRGNDLDFTAQMAAIKQRNAASILASMTRGQDFKKFTDSTRNKMLDRANVMANIQTSLETFKPEYTQRLGKYSGQANALPNTLAGVGIGTKGSKEAQLWWADWEKFYTLPERNLMFGATLTPNEQAAWKAVNINPGMDPDVISKKLAAFNKVMSEGTLRRARSMTVEGFDPSVIQEMYQDVMPPMDLGTAALPNGGGGPAGKLRVDSSMSEYSTAEIEDMLRQLTQGESE